MFSRVALAATLCLSVGTISSFAQEFGRAEDIVTEGTSYYVFARPGEATVQIYVLGSVEATGIYEVGVDTDLAQLMAMTGGVDLGPRSRGERREITVRVLRRSGGQRVAIYEAALPEMLREPDRYPDLRDGDVYEIDVVIRPARRWTEIVRNVASFATLALAIERLVTLNR